MRACGAALEAGTLLAETEFLESGQTMPCCSRAAPYFN